MRIRITATELRDIVGEEIFETIDGHRASRDFTVSDYRKPEGEPTEQEITDFIRTNQLLDIETIEFLTEPDFLGFEARTDSVRAEWLEEFRSNVSDWSETESWLGADLIDVVQLILQALCNPPRGHRAPGGWQLVHFRSAAAKQRRLLPPSRVSNIRRLSPR